MNHWFQPLPHLHHLIQYYFRLRVHIYLILHPSLEGDLREVYFHNLHKKVLKLHHHLNHPDYHV
jgi:hypothetical protein